MPPSVADWLDPDHLVWFLLGVVEELDLAAFYAAYRRDGRGGAAFDPTMMVALFLYAYAIGERSSRKLEERCRVDVAFRVLCANHQPDHTTISRFRQQHETALEDLFTESVRLCANAGLGRVATVAIDGRKVAANASMGQSRTRESIEREARRWLEDAAAIDAAEDAEFGPGHSGNPVPPELADPKTRKERIKRAMEELNAQDAAHQADHDARVARRAEHIERTGKAPAGRPPTGRKMPGNHKVNITDPHSRILKRRGGFIQGFNAEAVVSEDQIVVGAKVVRDANDQAQLGPMIEEAQRTLKKAGVERIIDNVLADAGFGTDDELANAETDPDAPELFIATGHRTRRDGSIDPDTPRGRMDAKLLTEPGKAMYNKRCWIVEPVFGQHHVVQRFDRFSRRGIHAVNAEFKLVNAVHNLLKLWRHQNADPAPA